MLTDAVLIRLAYRQVIDAGSTTEFERSVFNDSYQEFLTQAQGYNPENKFITLGEMIEANPKAASLHYKVGFSIGHHIQRLNGLMPGLYDRLNGVQIPFDRHRFTLLESSVVDNTAHKTAITYIKDDVWLYAVLPDRLLLSFEREPKEGANGYVDTFELSLQPALFVAGIKRG